MKRRHHRATSRSPLGFDQLRAKATLAGLSALLAFAAVYVHADGARIVLAFGSGIGVGAVMCLAASSGPLRKG
jgi:hypothetical protein